MPRPVKEKPKEVAGISAGIITIDVNDYVRTRDQFVSGLATLQDAIQNLSTAYIKHTNAVLGDSGEGLGIDLALSKLGENPILGVLAAAAAGPSGLAAIDDKKERKKRQHDPNAPKRPLTPFFLYMQTARPIIANDLGPDVPKGHVSEEGTKRWKLLGPSDRDLWTDAYKQNLRLYHARMRSYKSDQNLEAKNMSDADALAYAETHSIGIETSADAQLVGEAHGAILDEDEDAEGEPDKEPTPPPAVVKPTPKSKSNRKGKGGKAAAAPEAIIPAATSIVPPKQEAPTPAKNEKRKRSNKKDDVEEPATEAPKSTSKPRKKKAKADS